MKPFVFLMNHLNFKMTYSSSDDICYEFYSGDKNIFEQGIILIPKNEHCTADDVRFVYMSEHRPSGYDTLEDTPYWFQEIFREAKEKVHHLTRLKNLFKVEGR